MSSESKLSIDGLGGYGHPAQQEPPRLNTGQQKIKGYRDLTPAELEMINASKMLADDVGQFLTMAASLEGDVVERTRWLYIARTDLQKGFMALQRAIALPVGF